MSSHDRWKCQKCGHIAADSELLMAENPFDPEDGVTGCPKCKSVDSFEAVCAIDGCNKDGSCGGPHEDGLYKWTCFEHSMLNKKDKP